MPRSRSLLLAVVVTLLAAPAASAGTVTAHVEVDEREGSSATVIVWHAAAGERNELTVATAEGTRCASATPAPL